MRAAVVIQSYYRGYIDRCKFLEMLYDQYEKVKFTKTCKLDQRQNIG